MRFLFFFLVAVVAAVVALELEVHELDLVQTAPDFNVPGVRGDVRDDKVLSTGTLEHLASHDWEPRTPPLLPPTPAPDGRSFKSEIGSILQPLPAPGSSIASSGFASSAAILRSFAEGIQWKGVMSKYDVNQATPRRYTIQMYKGRGVFELERTWRENDKQMFEVIKNRKVFQGVIERGGKYAVEACEALDSKKLAREAGDDHKPAVIDEKKNIAAKIHCPECTGMVTLYLSGRKYLVLLSPQGVPKIAVSRDSFIRISSFSTGRQTWTARTLDDAECRKAAASIGNPPVEPPPGPIIEKPAEDTREALLEEEEEAWLPPSSHNALVENLIGKPNAAGIYTKKDDAWWKFEHVVYFRERNGLWLWTFDKRCWMSVATSIPLCGKKKGDKPRKVFTSILKRLWNMEKGLTRRPLTDSEFRYLLGKPRSSSGTTTRWRIRVDWSEDLDFKEIKTGKHRKFSWSPNEGGVWYPVTTKKDTRSWWKKERLTDVNKRLIDALLYYQELADKTDGVDHGQCKATWRGDGYCDDACNTAQHNWDGGDCCRGTCSDSQYVCGSAGYKCKGTANGRPCLFLHGAGVPGHFPPRFSSQNPSMTNTGLDSLGILRYFADFAKELQGICKSVRYVSANTDKYGWDTPELKQAYYAEAKKIYDDGGAVFAHSMANLILAGACLDEDKCGVKWFDAGGPLRGSNAANRAGQFAKIFPKMDDGSTGTLKYSYRGLSEGKTQRGELGYIAWKKRLIKGLLCGTSTTGSGGKGGFLLTVSGVVSFGNRENDGLVALDECEMFTYKDPRDGKWKFWYFRDRKGKLTSSSREMRSMGHHLDLTGAKGNYDNIITWYRNMAKIK